MRERLLRFCARLALDRPLAVVLVAAALAALGVLYAATSLRLNANTDDLISPNRPYMQNYRAFLERWGDLEAIWVVVEAPEGEEGRRAAERACDTLGERLRTRTGIPGVFWKIDVEEQLRLSTHSKEMSDEDLRGLAEARGALPLLMSGGGEDELIEDARQNLNRLIGLGGFLGEEKQRELGARAFLLTDLLLRSTPQATSADAEEPRREYIHSASGRFHFIRLEPEKDYGTLAVIEEPLRKIREVLRETEKEFPDLAFGLTGKPVLQADEMATSDRDMTRATIAAIFLVGILFVTIIGGLLRPALAVLTLLLAVGWTFGITTLVVGQLNLLSVVFTLVLVGIGIDFGVHIVTRYYEERRRHPLREAVKRSVLAVGRGNLTGATTSSLAFFMAMFTGFQGLVELGFIAGSGLLLCVVAMTLVLPAAIVLTRRRRDEELPRAASGADSVEDAKLEGAASHVRGLRARLILAGAVSLVALFFASKVGFDDDVLKLQAQDLDSVVWEKKILEDDAAESWFGAIPVGSLENLERLHRKATRQPAIGKVHSVLDLVAVESPERKTWRRQIAEAAEPGSGDGSNQDAETPWSLKDIEDLRRAFERLEALAGRRGDPEELGEITRRREGLVALEAGLADPESEIASRRRAAIATTREEARRSFGAIVEGASRPMRDALPELPRRLFTSETGGYLLMMHPTKNVWNLDYMAEYVEAMRSVHPDVTGAPITHLESIHEMRRGFLRAALLAFVAVIGVVLLDFRSLGLTFLAIFPLGVAGLWLLGAMGALGLSFNLANFFSIPILIGIGVDNGVHLVHRWREGILRGVFDLGATRRAVLMTSLTTAVGFGCLASASHLGLRSLGYIMALGSVAILLASTVVLPAILKLMPLGRRRATASDPAEETIST